MNPELRFNLVNENWIPIVGKSRVSLMDVFSDDSICDIDGTAIEKIALTKLLIAVAQASVTVKDKTDWKEMGASGLAACARTYLETNRDCFWLYGDRPFLQMPSIAKLKDEDPNFKTKPVYYYHQPSADPDNDTMLFGSQGKADGTDAERAVFLVTLMNYAFGGKGVSSKVPLMEGIEKKSAQSAPSLGNIGGFLQVCLKGSSLQETVWLNFFTEEDKRKLHVEAMDARPPWEKMPEGETDDRANEIKDSLYAWLVALARFVYLPEDGGMYYIDGINYPKAQDRGAFGEPFFVASSKKGAMLVDPAEKPWRNLTAFLRAVYEGDNPENGYVCQLLSLFLLRAIDTVDALSIWAGGLKVSSKSGEQYVKQADDFVDSEFSFESSVLGEDFYQVLKETMKHLDQIAKDLQVSVSQYYKDMKVLSEKASYKECAAKTKEAVRRFWESAEGCYDKLIKVCEDRDEDKLRDFIREMNLKAKSVYDDICPHASARQMYAWINNRTPKPVGIKEKESV